MEGCKGLVRNSKLDSDIFLVSVSMFESAGSAIRLEIDLETGLLAARGTRREAGCLAGLDTRGRGRQ